MDAHHTAFTTPRVITASKTKAGDQDQTGRLRLKRAPAHTIMKAGARRKGASSLCSRLDDQAFDGSDLSSSEEYARGDALSSGHDDTDEDYDEGEATNEKRRKGNRHEIKASESEGEGPESENGEFSSNEDRNYLTHFELKAEELGALRKELGTEATKAVYAELSLKEQMRRRGPTRNRKPNTPLHIESCSCKSYEATSGEATGVAGQRVQSQRDVCPNGADGPLIMRVVYSTKNALPESPAGDDDDGVEDEEEELDITEPREAVPVVAIPSWRCPPPGLRHSGRGAALEREAERRTRSDREVSLGSSPPPAHSDFAAPEAEVRPEPDAEAEAGDELPVREADPEPPRASPSRRDSPTAEDEGRRAQIAKDEALARDLAGSFQPRARRPPGLLTPNADFRGTARRPYAEQWPRAVLQRDLTRASRQSLL